MNFGQTNLLRCPTCSCRASASSGRRVDKSGIYWCFTTVISPRQLSRQNVSKISLRPHFLLNENIPASIILTEMCKKYTYVIINGANIDLLC